MVWTEVEFRGRDDGRTFNTRTAVGYFVPRWSTQFILFLDGVHSLLPTAAASFFHTIYPLP